MYLSKLKSGFFIVFGIIVVLIAFYLALFKGLSFFDKSGGSIILRGEGLVIALLGVGFIGYGVSIKCFRDENAGKTKRP